MSKYNLLVTFHLLIKHILTDIYSTCTNIETYVYMEPFTIRIMVNGRSYHFIKLTCDIWDFHLKLTEKVTKKDKSYR